MLITIRNTKVWKGSVKVGPANSQIEVPAFNTAILSADATQAGTSLTGTEGAELVLVSAIVHGVQQHTH